MGDISNTPMLVDHRQVDFAYLKTLIYVYSNFVDVFTIMLSFDFIETKIRTICSFYHRHTFKDTWNIYLTSNFVAELADKLYLYY